MIYLECKADQTLVRALTRLPGREISHERNKSEVAKSLSETRNALGMVDEDPTAPTQPPYLTRMRTLRDMRDSGLKVLIDTSRGNRVVVLCPRLEDWIIRAAQEADIDLTHSRYNLPNTARRLHGEINIDLRKFERLLQDLIESAAPRLASLREELQAQ
jgi:hypothetical protein